MNIYLTGFMGSGKSTTGKALADALQMEFVDLDEEIEKKSGKKISVLFLEEGETTFRKLEHETLEVITGSDNLIVACGGGTPCFSGNMDLMNSTGITIYLKMSVKSLSERLSETGNERPLLEGKKGAALEEFIHSLLEKREPWYRQASFTVKANKLEVKELARVLQNTFPEKYYSK